ncbi:MAG: hypothetical protein K2W33_04495 [Burkholderiales bacterium]|nr:hypothetical protein [Burkholderiales bacterium]
MSDWLGVLLGLSVVVAPLLLAWLFMSCQALDRETSRQRHENRHSSGGQP